MKYLKYPYCLHANAGLFGAGKLREIREWHLPMATSSYLALSTSGGWWTPKSIQKFWLRSKTSAMWEEGHQERIMARILQDWICPRFTFSGPAPSIPSTLLPPSRCSALAAAFWSLGPSMSEEIRDSCDQVDPSSQDDDHLGGFVALSVQAEGDFTPWGATYFRTFFPNIDANGFDVGECLQSKNLLEPNRLVLLALRGGSDQTRFAQGSVPATLRDQRRNSAQPMRGSYLKSNPASSCHPTLGAAFGRQPPEVHFLLDFKYGDLDTQVVCL